MGYCECSAEKFIRLLIRILLELSKLSVQQIFRHNKQGEQENILKSGGQRTVMLNLPYCSQKNKDRKQNRGWQTSAGELPVCFVMQGRQEQICKGRVTEYASEDWKKAGLLPTGCGGQMNALAQLR